MKSVLNRIVNIVKIIAIFILLVSKIKKLL